MCMSFHSPGASRQRVPVCTQALPDEGCLKCAARDTQLPCAQGAAEHHCMGYVEGVP